MLHSYRKIVLGIAVLVATTSSNAQTVFTDLYNRATFGTTGGTPTMTYNVASGTVTMSGGSGSFYGTLPSAASAGTNYISAPITTFSSPFNATLSSNGSIVTWTFNMRSTNAATSLPSATAISGGVDLCGDAGANIFTGSPNGYAVMFNPGSTGGVEFVRFAGGMAASGCTELITPSSSMSKTNFYSVRVTYNPVNNLWSLYLRDDGASAFADPSTGVTTLIGSVTDNTYTSGALTRFGFAYGYNAGAGKSMGFDNFSVAIGPAITYTTLASPVCSTGDRSLSANITNAPTSGGNLPRVYYRKNSGSWFSSAGSFSSGTTYNFTISASAMGGLTNGDIVSYYVIAQDVSSYAVVNAKPYTGLVATSVNSVTTAPTTPNTYYVGTPVVSPTASPNPACIGVTMTLNSGSTGGTTYSWTGPASYTSAVQNPSFTAAASSAGIYTLVATNTCGSVSGTTPSVTAIAAPTITVTPTSATVCAGSFKTLTAAGGSTYTWAPATGLNTTTGATVIATPNATTTYTVTGSNGSCINVATAALTYTLTPFSASALSTPAITCNGGSTTLTGTARNSMYNTLTSIPYAIVTQTSPTSIANADWQFSSNDDDYLNVALPFTFNFYGVNYSSVNIGTNGFINFGTATTTNATFTYPNTGAPRAAIAIFESDLVCPSNSVKYSTEGSAPNRKFVVYYTGEREYGGTGNVYIGQVVLYETSNIVDIIVTSTLSQAKTCGIQNAAGTSALTVAGENNVAYTISTPEAWRFTGVPTASYSWSPSTSLSATTGMSVFGSPISATTTYTVITTDSATGCTAMSNTTIAVGTLPGTISGTTSICSGASANITISGPVGDTAVYTIDGGSPRTAVIGAAGTVVISTGAITASTTYTLTNIKAFPCNQTITGQTATITVNPAAGPITGTSPLCPGTSATFTDGVAGGTWTSSATGVATVSPSGGVVTGIAAGAATISYTVGSCTPATYSLVINGTPAGITPATAVSVCATATTTLANTATGGVWTSGDTTIATVNSSTGVVTGVAAGSVSITYSTGCGSDTTKTITVNTMPAVITGIGYAAAPAAVCTLSVYNSFTNTVSGGTWSNSPTTVGTINSSTGIFNATTSTGTTIITYTLGTCAVTASLSVGSSSPVAITGTTTVCATSTTTLADATPSGVWSSSNLAVATVVPATGVVRGVNAGTTTITYDNGCGSPATTTVTVNGSTPALTTDTMCSGGTLHLNAALAASGTYSWSGPNGFSSTLQNATLSGATTNAAGTYTFSTTSTVGTCTSSGQVFAIVDTLPNVTVTASPSSMCAGSTSALSSVISSPLSYTMYAIPYAPLTVATGTNGPNGDDAQSNVTLPFTFNYLGTNFNNVHICTNGFINFGAGNTSFSPVSLPDGGAAQGMVALFWHDLTATAGQIKYTTFGSTPNRKFVINYNAVADLSGAGTNTGQVILYETSNMIDVFVARSNVGAATNVCGIQNNARTFALTPPGENGTTFTVTGPGEGWRFVTPSYTYNWLPSTGLSSGTIYNPTANPSTTQVYTVTTADIYSSCAGNVRTQTLTVNPMPTTYTVTGGGNYCGVTPLSIGLSNADPAVSYQLIRGTTPVGGAVTGASGSFSFGTFTTAGTYIVQATGTGGCIDTMTGTAVITNSTVGITVGANPSVCQPTTTATLSYSSPTGSPTNYDITWDAAALTAGFSNVTSGTLGATIPLTIPTGSAGSFNGSLTVTNGVCTSTTYNFTVTVYAYPTGTITSAVVPCSGYATNVVFTGTSGATVAYKIDGGSLVNATLTGGTYSLTTGVITASHTYTLYDVHNPVCTTVIDTTITIAPTPMTWLGGTAGHLTDWNTPTNWSCGFVPTTIDNVHIGLTANAPEVAASTTVNTLNLTVDSGVIVTIDTLSKLIVGGNFVNNGTIADDGTISLASGSTQNISGKGLVSNFELNNVAGATIVSGSKMTFNSSLTLTAGMLTTNDSLVLGADSTSYGYPFFKNVNIRPILAAGAGISGNVRVQQYLPAGRRAYRFWSHPFSSYTSLSQVENYIDVTGPGGASNGFTTTASNAPSAFRYNPAAGNSALASDPGWKPFASALGTVDSNRLHRYQGIRLFYRGAKGQGLGYDPYTPASTVATQWGPVNQGNQTIPLVKGSGANQDYNMVGNPYPSATNLGAAMYNAKATGNIVGAAYYIFNPYLGTAGQFQAITISTISATASPYPLQMNCAFQVRAAHNGDTLNFTEADKTNSYNSLMLRTNSEYISLTVYNANYHPYDMLSIQFNDHAKNEEDRDYDATKPPSVADFNFYSISDDQQKLAIDARPFAEDKVIPLGVTSANKGEFIVKAENIKVPENGTLYLHDKLLKQYVLLQQGTEYRFAISDDMKTQGNDRFELKMSPADMSQATIAKSLQMTLIPNPATDEVNIAFVSDNKNVVSLRMLDLAGVSVYDQNLGVKESGSVNVSLNRFAPGVYMVELISGDQKMVQRLIKE